MTARSSPGRRSQATYRRSAAALCAAAALLVSCVTPQEVGRALSGAEGPSTERAETGGEEDGSGTEAAAPETRQPEHGDGESADDEPPAPTGEAPDLESEGDLEVVVCPAPETADDERRGQAPDGGIALVDVTAELGIDEPLRGMLGHAFAAGDVTGDGWLDVFVGTFADRPDETYQVRGADGPSPDRLLVGGPAGLATDADFPGTRERSSGALMADLTLDGHLDLVVARNPRGGDGAGAGDTVVYRNDGSGLAPATTLPGLAGARAVGALDLEGNGRLDLVIVTDRWRGDGTRVLRNDGELRFTDVTREVGIPEDVSGLGVGVADLTGNGHADVFVAGDNRLFLNDGAGRFDEHRTDVFDWEIHGDEDDVAGVAIGDLTRNGWPDLVVGHHFNSTVDDGTRVPVRLYLHEGLDGDGAPVFRDVTDEAGLPALPTKAPHVEIADLDNDGWPDLVTSASAAGGDQPAVLRHEGVRDGIPRFSTPEGLGDEQYWVTGGTVDLTRDGRLEVVLIEWFPELPSRAWSVAGDVGNWLQVRVPPHAFGADVQIHEAGQGEDPDALVLRREVVASVGYAAGAPPQIHAGLGDREEVHLSVRLPDGRSTRIDGVPANHVVVVDGDCR